MSVHPTMSEREHTPANPPTPTTGEPLGVDRPGLTQEPELEIDRESLVKTFAIEAGETISNMEQLLLVLETKPEDEETLHSLFRAAHTLKGSSSTVAFDGIRDLSHAAEDLLARMRSQALSVNSDLISLLLQTLDVLRMAVADAAAGETVSSEVEAARERLRRAAELGSEEQCTPQTQSNPAPVAVSTAASGATGTNTLRVDISKLDQMVNLSGEIAISRDRLADMLERRLSLTVDEILEAHRQADQLYLDLQDLIMQARMAPLEPIFRQQLRTVRDLAKAQQKQVRLALEGEEVEVDTSVVEHIRDPLVHMIRNAVDHGIESPAERRQQGKNPCGQITLRAFYEGAQVVIQVADDGSGLDRERILRRAVKTGILAEGARPSDEKVFALIFEPGFSTCEQITDVSGRGVGLDVVRCEVESLRGSVSVSSRASGGTTFTLRFPLTLAIIQGFRVAVAGEAFILPLDTVLECIELPPGNGTGRSGIVSLRDRPLPYLRLREYFAIGGEAPTRESIVVVQHAGRSMGLVVDALLGESRTIIKPLGRMLQRICGICGSAILGDGRVALLLDVPGLLRDLLHLSTPTSA